MIRQDIRNFKVGDLVRIKKGLVVGTRVKFGHNQTLTVLEDMIEGCGRVAKIVSFYATDAVYIPQLEFKTSNRNHYLDVFHYDWSMLEEVNHIEEGEGNV